MEGSLDLICFFSEVSYITIHTCLEGYNFIKLLLTVYYKAEVYIIILVIYLDFYISWGSVKDWQKQHTYYGIPNSLTDSHFSFLSVGLQFFFLKIFKIVGITKGKVLTISQRSKYVGHIIFYAILRHNHYISYYGV